MKSIFMPALLLVMATTSSPLIAQVLWDTTSVAPTNKIELFNGKDFTGWQLVSKTLSTTAPLAGDLVWSVTNGVIHCLGKPSGYARTEQCYRDYRLHVEWRFPEGAGNSGVFLHLNPPDKVWPLCFEAQLQSGNAGEVRLNGGSHIDGLAADAKAVPMQSPSSEKPLGEWNSYDIVCHSNSITVRVNGVVQNKISGTSVISGAIGLQAEGKPVEFRNVYIEPVE